MKRDSDYIREMLFKFEETTDWTFARRRAKNLSEQEEKQNYHIELLCDAGLMCAVSGAGFRMTNQGHDFLDAIRDDGIWGKIKRETAERGGSLPFEIVKALGIGLLKKHILKHTDLEL